MKRVRTVRGLTPACSEADLSLTATDERRITFCHVYTALLDYFKVCGAIRNLSVLTTWMISTGADESIHVHVVASAHRGIALL